MRSIASDLKKRAAPSSTANPVLSYSTHLPLKAKVAGVAMNWLSVSWPMRRLVAGQPPATTAAIGGEHASAKEQRLNSATGFVAGLTDPCCYSSIVWASFIKISQQVAAIHFIARPPTFLLSVWPHSIVASWYHFPECVLEQQPWY